VVGVSQTLAGNNAILWLKGELGVLRAISGEPTHGQAFDISPSGEIVGESTTPGGATHATLWTRR
jgi:hypothetical protein